MTDPTKREIERELEALKRLFGESDTDSDADTDAEVTVEWRVPASPDPADEGMTYEPETETITYALWRKQQACLDALESGDYDIVAFLGGYGTGKTVFGARWLLAKALAHPESCFLALGKTFEEARESTFKKLFAQLPGDNTVVDPERSPVVTEYTKSERRLTLTNGTVIVLGSADKPDRYDGAEFGGIWLDEPSYYNADLHDLLATLDGRLRGVDGPKVMCWTLTGNGFNDAWKILEQRQKANDEPLKHSIRVIRASTLENPYLEPEVRASQKRKYGDTDRAAQALHGGFAAATGLVYSAFNRETHVIPHAEAAERVVDDWRVYGYDSGWNDPRVVLELGKTSFDQLVVVDAFHETGVHTEDAIDWLADRPFGVIYSEHKPAHIDKFERAGFDATTAVKDIDEGIAEVRKRLEADGNLEISTELRPKKRTVRVPIMGLPDSPRSRSRRFRSDSTETDTEESDSDSSETDTGEPAVGLLVSERCQELIREFYSYKADHVGAPNAADHCLDALRYAVMGVATPEQ
ncbi:phage terminase large subunit [Natronococcus sp. A-GB1]|uniref:phage terminase large subunit n=1 Tax=Natronococcus sp. A-GB1 TaxID=3037648 RepID=UPI00242023AD|nr:phage terminase large subunit [Natronococcus sp. A-GB1]MDG5761532.1 phage terminase large subunit [Natronococcus sp. A-GB1]